MLNRQKKYRVLVSGYWKRADERGHFSTIMNLPYNRLNQTRKLKLENQLINIEDVENIAITGFVVQS